MRLFSAIVAIHGIIFSFETDETSAAAAHNVENSLITVTCDPSPQNKANYAAGTERGVFTVDKGTFSEDFSDLIERISSVSKEDSRMDVTDNNSFELSITLPNIREENVAEAETKLKCIRQGDVPTEITQVVTHTCQSMSTSSNMNLVHVKNENFTYLSGGLNDNDLNVKYEIITKVIRNEEHVVVGVEYEYVAVRMEDINIDSGTLSPPEYQEMSLPDDMNDASVGPKRQLSTTEKRFLLSPEDDIILIPFKNGKLSQHMLPEQKKLSQSSMNRRLSDDGSKIDIIYYFTKRAMCQWSDQEFESCIADDSSNAIISTKIAATVIMANQAYSNSGISLTLNNVGWFVDKSGYDESTSPNTEVILTDLKTIGDGKLDNAHVLRDDHSADLVAGIFSYIPSVGLAAKGLAYVPKSFPDREVGFSVSGGNYAIITNVLTHEIGHNQGCNHNKKNNPPGVGFNNGFVDCTHCFLTLMSYTNTCSIDCLATGQTKINYFSNPDKKYNSHAMGDELTDNAKQITTSKIGVAMNRYEFPNKIISLKERSRYDSLTTVTFDIEAKEDITLKNMEVHFIDSSRREVEVFSVSGTREGNDNDDSFWGKSLVQEEVVPLSEKNAVYANMASFATFPDIVLLAGSKYAFKIVSPSKSLFGGGSNTASDGDEAIGNSHMSIKWGRGNGFVVSNFFGALVYQIGGPSISSNTPTSLPTQTKSVMPSNKQSQSPSHPPSMIPSISSNKPTSLPTDAHSLMPSEKQSHFPSHNPSMIPSISSNTPTSFPTQTSSGIPSKKQSQLPSKSQSINPSVSSNAPSFLPTYTISVKPSKKLSQLPSHPPSMIPSVSSNKPTAFPTETPSVMPSKKQSQSPSSHQSIIPSVSSDTPSFLPTEKNSLMPSKKQSQLPSNLPSIIPSVSSNAPSFLPTNIYSVNPSNKKSILPSNHPITLPTVSPNKPTSLPTKPRSLNPSKKQSQIPSYPPSVNPSVSSPISPNLCDKACAKKKKKICYHKRWSDKCKGCHMCSQVCHPKCIKRKWTMVQWLSKCHGCPSCNIKLTVETPNPILSDDKTCVNCPPQCKTKRHCRSKKMKVKCVDCPKCKELDMV